MATPGPKLPKEWADEVQKLSSWYGNDEKCAVAHVQVPASAEGDGRLVLALHRMGLSLSAHRARSLVSLYLVESEAKLDQLSQEWVLAGHSDGMKPSLSAYNQIGMVANSDHDDKLIIIDADASNSLAYAIAMIELSLLASMEGEAVKRFVWLSSGPVDEKLGRMLAVSTNQSTIHVTTFRLTQPADLPSLRSLRWIQHDATGEEYLVAAMRKIGSDFGGTTKVVIFWDEGSQYARIKIQTKLQVFKEQLGGSMRFEHANDWKPGNNGVSVVVSGVQKKSLISPAQDAQHLILLSAEMKEVFDRETSLVVKKTAPLSRARMLAQATCALSKEVDHTNLAIHSQVALQDILDMEPERQFEELHLPLFIIMVMYNYPQINTERLRDCFSLGDSEYVEASRRLHVLGYLQGIDETVCRLDKNMTKKALDLIPCTEGDLHVARFLSCITESTPIVARLAMIEIAAIVIMFRKQDALVKVLQQEYFEQHGTEMLLEYCSDDVPEDLLHSGPIWLALAVYREFGPRYAHSVSATSYLMFEKNRFLVSTNACGQIHRQAGMITSRLREMVPERVSDTSRAISKLSPEDVSQIQGCMVRAWAHNVSLPDGYGNNCSIFFGGQVHATKEQGLYLPDVSMPWISFGFDLEGWEYQGYLTTTIPKEILFEVFDDMGLELGDFATVYERQ